jgi:hypothetical protein
MYQILKDRSMIIHAGSIGLIINISQISLNASALLPSAQMLALVLWLNNLSS